MQQSPLQQAVEFCGGQSELARRINVKQSYIWYWLNKAGRVPAEHVIPIEDATGGQVSRHDLRPDLYPPEPTGEAA